MNEELFIWKIKRNKRNKRIKYYNLQLEDSLHSWEIQAIFKNIIQTKWDARKLERSLIKNEEPIKRRLKI